MGAAGNGGVPAVLSPGRGFEAGVRAGLPFHSPQYSIEPASSPLSCETDAIGELTLARARKVTIAEQLRITSRGSRARIS